MRMEDSVVDAALVLKPLETRIEAATSAGFKGVIVDWVNRGRTRILLDLAEVDFIDSSGLGALISSLKSIGEGGKLAICNVSPPVMKIFQLTRMFRIFKIFDSKEKALSFLNN